jgi:hypothetical protein
VRPAIMPDWWDDRCSEDPQLLQDIEVRLARFLGVPLAVVRDTGAPLQSLRFPKAQLRHMKGMADHRLSPAIHSAMRIAEAVVRNLNEKNLKAEPPPPDPLAWRDEIGRAHSAITLDDLLDDLWKRGIPVIPIDVLPAPRFQGMACIVNDRPVILLGYKQDEPGRIAYVIAHEAAHIAEGHCTSDRPVIDETDEIADNAAIEKQAEHYATSLLVGHATISFVPDLNIDFRDLARRAVEIEAKKGVDASALIFAWAQQTRDYMKATMAVKALYRHVGARRKLRERFDHYVSLADAAESDRALLRCLYGDPDRDEVAD